MGGAMPAPQRDPRGTAQYRRAQPQRPHCARSWTRCSGARPRWVWRAPPPGAGSAHAALTLVHVHRLQHTLCAVPSQHLHSAAIMMYMKDWRLRHVQCNMRSLHTGCHLQATQGDVPDRYVALPSLPGHACSQASCARLRCANRCGFTPARSRAGALQQAAAVLRGEAARAAPGAHPTPPASGGVAREAFCGRTHLEDVRGLPAGPALPHPRLFMHGAPCTRERNAPAARPRPRVLSESENDSLLTADAKQLSAAASSDRLDGERAHREPLTRLGSRCRRCGRRQTLHRPSGSLGSAADVQAPTASAWSDVQEPPCRTGVLECGGEGRTGGQSRVCQGHTAGRAAGLQGAWQHTEEHHRCDRHGSRAGSRARTAGTPGERVASRSRDMRVLLWGLQAGMAALAPGLP